MLLHSPESCTPDGMLHSCMRDIFHFSLACLGNTPEMSVWRGGGSFKSERWLDEPSVCTSQSHLFSTGLLLVQFSTLLLPKSVLSGKIKVFAAVVCSFCNEAQHSFNKTAIIVAPVLLQLFFHERSGIVTITPYFELIPVSPGRKKKGKVHWSRLLLGKASPAFYSVLFCWLFAVLCHPQNSLLFSPFVLPSRRWLRSMFVCINVFCVRTELCHVFAWV